MHIDPYIVLGSAVIGFLVGMTGAGGGALMTPMLILLFGVTPVGGDLQRSRGRGRDAPDRRRRTPQSGTVNLRLVRLDGARLGADGVWAHTCCISSATRKRLKNKIERSLGAALLIGAAAMVLRFVLDRRRGERRDRRDRDVVSAAAADGGDRDGRRPDRGDDLGRLGLADDRRCCCSSTR